MTEFDRDLVKNTWAAVVTTLLRCRRPGFDATGRIFRRPYVGNPFSVHCHRSRYRIHVTRCRTFLASTCSYASKRRHREHKEFCVVCNSLLVGTLRQKKVTFFEHAISIVSYLWKSRNFIGCWEPYRTCACASMMARNMTFVL